MEISPVERAKNQKALDATTGQDSLFTLALNGADGKFGFVKIAAEYSGTDAGNLANYYAGIAYLNTGKYTEAIDYLGKFSSEDIVLSALAKGAIGDAFAQKNAPEITIQNKITTTKISDRNNLYYLSIFFVLIKKKRVFGFHIIITFKTSK